MTEKKTNAQPIYLFFSVLATAGIFAYLLTHVSLSEVLHLIRDADRRAVAMFVVLSLGMSIFRLWRYDVLLRLSGFRPGRVALFLVVLVRNFFSDLLPARLGSLIYIFLVTTRLGVHVGAATSSFALAFLFDMIALVPMIVLAVWFAGAAGRIPAGGLIAGSAFLAVVTVALIAVLPKCFTLAEAIWRRLRFLPAKWIEKGASVFREAEADTRRAREAGMYLRLLLLSMLVRVCKYGCLYAFLFALLHPRGYELADLSVSRVFLGLCASEAAASTPVSGIAGFGAYEGTWSTVFEALGFPADIAKLTSISHHLFTQVYGYSLGALALLLLLLPVFRVAGPAAAGPAERDGALAFYAKTTAVVGALCLALAGLYWI